MSRKPMTKEAFYDLAIANGFENPAVFVFNKRCYFGRWVMKTMGSEPLLFETENKGVEVEASVSSHYSDPWGGMARARGWIE